MTEKEFESREEQVIKELKKNVKLTPRNILGIRMFCVVWEDLFCRKN